MGLHLTIGKKIAFGIVLMLVLMIVVGLAGYFGLTGILKAAEFSNQIAGMYKTVARTEAYVDKYLVGTYSGNKDLQSSALQEVSSRIREAANQIEEIKKDASGDGIGTSQKLEYAGTEIAQYGEVFNQYRACDDEKAKLEKTVDGIFAQMLENIGKGVIRIEELTLATNVSRTSIANYFKLDSAENWAKAEEGLKAVSEKFKAWWEFVRASAQLNELAEVISKQIAELNAVMGRHHSLTLTQVGLKKKMEEHAGNLETVCRELVNMSDKSMQNQTQLSSRLIFGFIALALLFGTAYAMLSVKGIVKGLKQVIDRVEGGTEQVALAAGQVATSSQSLADGASQQASSLEETSSSLEQMSSLTRHNAERAKEAKALMTDVYKIVDKVNKHMNNMAEAVQEITISSEKTGKIVKTIDEIAFQTNLLALNAAVEAARAGEAGAGFAVVADEVRNLALRAAEASKNTAQLIEGTIRTIKTGSELTISTKEAFNENVTITSKVGQLVDEISVASHEQAQGIEEINRAVGEMSRITQSNAASAEESASAAEEMRAQAEQMRIAVDSMVAMVGGRGNGSLAKKAKVQRERQSEGVLSVQAPGKAFSQVRGGNGKAPAITQIKESRADSVTPTGYEEFKDF